MTDLFSKHLDRLKAQGRYRALNLPNGIDLTSNDYLGLANSDVLRGAALDYLQNGGDIGAGGSRLLRGHCDAHAALESFAADHFCAPATLYFSSGFQVNTTLFQTLPSRHDVIIFDEYIHASMREGIQNSHAKHIKAAHNDITAFEQACEKACDKAANMGAKQIWIAVESVYSMDGDIAPLADLRRIAETYNAVLIIDEAHAVGAMGTDGKGLAHDLYAGQESVMPDNIITIHTCGKALGVAGAIMCASQTIIDTMINTARGFIYSTAPMPIQAYLVQKALEFCASPDGAARRAQLTVLSEIAQTHFGGTGSYIVPIIIGDDARAVAIAQSLQGKGWDIRAIRPPTIAEGTARLRLSLNADLTEELLTRFAQDYNNVLGMNKDNK